jgi:hypothetical protein
VTDDRTGDERRTTVSEAAEILGISVEAVRGRIRRGTIPVEREGGTVYVLIEGTERHRTTGDQSRTTDDRRRDTVRPATSRVRPMTDRATVRTC